MDLNDVRSLVTLVSLTLFVGLMVWTWWLALLLFAARRRVMSDDNTTGHVWDEDLRELNNPLPRWWMWLFVITVAFAVGYLVLYPGLGSAPGSLGWSSVSQHQGEQQQAHASTAPLFSTLALQSAP